MSYGLRLPPAHARPRDRAIAKASGDRKEEVTSFGRLLGV
jgi:hypothetical protein